MEALIQIHTYVTGGPYLPLTGGTLSGNLTVNAKILVNTDTIPGLAGGVVVIRPVSTNVGQSAIAIQDYAKITRWVINGQDAPDDYTFTLYGNPTGGASSWVRRMAVSQDGTFRLHAYTSNALIKTTNSDGTFTYAVAGTDYVVPSALSGYLPLTGGTLSNSAPSSSILTIKNTSSTGYSSIDFQVSNGTQLGTVGVGNASTSATNVRNQMYLYGVNGIVFLTNSSGLSTKMFLGDDGTLNLYGALAGTYAVFSSYVQTDRISTGGVAPYPNVALSIRGSLAGNNDTWGVYQGAVTHAPNANNVLAVGYQAGGSVNTGTYTGLSYRGFYQENLGASSGTGTLATAYGVYISTMNRATNNYSAYFADNVGIGTDTPTFKLDVSGTLRVTGTATLANINASAITGTTASFTVNTNATGTPLSIRNLSAGAAAGGQLNIGNDEVSNGAGFVLFSSGFTSSGQYRANGGYIYTNRSGGLTLHAEGNNSLYLATNNTAALTINGSSVSQFSARVGIGIAPVVGSLLHIYSSVEAYQIIEAGGGIYSYLQLKTPSSGNGYIIKNIATGNGALNKALYLWNDPGAIQLVPNGTIGNAFTVDTSGSVGIKGTQPAAWGSGTEGALQLKNAGIYGYSDYEAGITANAYYGGPWKRIGANTASMIYVSTDIEFRTAPSSTAESNITWVTPIKIANTGEVSFTAVGMSWSYSNPSTNYKNIDWGGGGMLYRNSDDAYISSNTYYSTTGWKAKYASSGGIGVMGLLQGNLYWDSYDGTTVAGTVYTMTNRFAVLKNGNVGINNQTPSTTLDVNGTTLLRGRLTLGTSSAQTYGQLNVWDATSGSGWSRLADFSNGTDANMNFYLNQVGASTKYAEIASYSTIPLVLNSTSGSGVGVGVIPKSWNTTFKTIQVNTASLSTNSNGYGYFGANFYSNTSGVDKYVEAGKSSILSLHNGGFRFYGTDTLGAANDTISFSTFLIVQSTGQFGFNTDNTTGVTGNTLYIRSSSSNVGQTAIAFQGYDKTNRFCINAQDGASDYRFSIYSAPTGANDWTRRFSISSSGNINIGSGTASDGIINIAGGQTFINTGQGGNVSTAYTAWDTITFNDEYSDVARGPNKIITYGRGSSWVGGIGIHNNTQAYYAGGTHKWYKFDGTTATLNLSLDGSGNLTATGGFFEGSDMRIKTLIEDNYVNMSILNVSAKLYEKNGKKELGYFAQDFEELLPNALSINENGFYDLSYRQVHTAKIAALEQRIKELEQQLKNK